MKHKTQPTQTTQPQLRFGGEGKSDGFSRSSMPTPSTVGATQSPPADETPKGVTLTSEAALTQLRAENERLKKQLQERDAHSSLKDKLRQAGARTPKLLLEAAKGALKLTAAGEIENAVEIIDALKEKFPEQFGGHTPPTVPSIDAGAGRVTKPVLTREALAKMKPSEIAELN